MILAFYVAGWLVGAGTVWLYTANQRVKVPVKK